MPANSSVSYIYRHTLPVRIMHWINVLCFFVLLMSGLNIFNAHPALNFGRSSYNGRPPVLEMKVVQADNGQWQGRTTILGHAFDTTGVLGLSVDPDGELAARGFPAWLTIPSGQWLAMARRWHLFFAWLFVINGICYLAYVLASRHLQRDLVPTRRDISSIGQSVRDHLVFRHPHGEAARHYNVLQKLAYLGVILILLPLIILMGWAMSPMLDSLLTGWVDILGGRQTARTIHFIVAWLLVAFVFVHVFEVIVSGVWNNMRSMISGRYAIATDNEKEDHEENKYGEK